MEYERGWTGWDVECGWIGVLYSSGTSRVGTHPLEFKTNSMRLFRNYWFHTSSLCGCIVMFTAPCNPGTRNRTASFSYIHVPCWESFAPLVSNSSSIGRETLTIPGNKPELINLPSRLAAFYVNTPTPHHSRRQFLPNLSPSQPERFFYFPLEHIGKLSSEFSNNNRSLKCRHSPNHSVIRCYEDGCSFPASHAMAQSILAFRTLRYDRVRGCLGFLGW